MPLELESLEASTAALERALAYSERIADEDTEGCEVVRFGVIQCFEVCYEICWKFMKRWIEQNVSATAVDGVSRRHLYRYAAEQSLITDVELWMNYHAARNETSHIYNVETAESVYRIAGDFAHDARKLYETLKQRND